MSIVRKGKSIDENATLWRYISLEAFINLLHTESLFFTPTAYYEKTDPFEGLMPEVAMKAFASISGRFLSEMQLNKEKIVNLALERYGAISEEHQKLIDELDRSIEEYRVHPRSSYLAISKRVTVNCWHKNENESEAMWRLYSKNGIAIKTTVASIVQSFENNGENHIIHVAPVKYIDFSNKEIVPADCVTDGYTFPLIKRSSFSHEQEVRFFITPEIDPRNPEKNPPSPIKVRTNLQALIENVYISPFSVEPFISSVQAICKKYGINLGIVEQSKFLQGHEDLLNALVL